MRAILGVPVITYLMPELSTTSYSALWEKIRSDLAVGIVFTMHTINMSEKKETDCTIMKNHAFSLIDAIPLLDSTGKIIERELYLVRDPRGPFTNPVNKNGWSAFDTDRWTQEYRNQIINGPYGFDPLD